MKFFSNFIILTVIASCGGKSSTSHFTKSTGSDNNGGPIRQVVMETKDKAVKITNSFDVKALYAHKPRKEVLEFILKYQTEIAKELVTTVYEIPSPAPVQPDCGSTKGKGKPVIFSYEKCGEKMTYEAAIFTWLHEITHHFSTEIRAEYGVNTQAEEELFADEVAQTIQKASYGKFEYKYPVSYLLTPRTGTKEESLKMWTTICENFKAFYTKLVDSEFITSFSINCGEPKVSQTSDDQSFYSYSTAKTAMTVVSPRRPGLTFVVLGFNEDVPGDHNSSSRIIFLLTEYNRCLTSMMNDKNRHGKDFIAGYCENGFAQSYILGASL